MAQINIRPMQFPDKKSIMGILRDTPEFSPSEIVVAEEVIDDHLRDPSGSGYRILVAEEGGSVHGYICYGPTPLTQGTWDLYWAAVSRAMRGKGIGKALWALAEDDIRDNGGRLAVIETSSKADYEPTRRFHRSRGYEQTGCVPDFYSPGDDKLIFIKSL